MTNLNTFALLKQTIFFFRHNVITIAAIQLPFLIIINLLTIWLENQAHEASELNSEMAILSLIRLTLLPIYWGATVLFIQSQVDGKNYSAPQAIWAGLRFWRSLLLIFLISGIAIFSGLLFFIIPGIYIGVRLAFADFICVIEQQSILQSLKQSWNETQEYFWTLLQGLLILYPGLQIANFYFVQQFSSQDDTSWLLKTVIFVILDLLSVLALIYSFRVYCIMRDEQRPTHHHSDDATQTEH